MHRLFLVCLLCATLPAQEDAAAWLAGLQAGSELAGEYRYAIYRGEQRLGGLSLVVVEAGGFHVELRAGADSTLVGVQQLWLDEHLRLLRWEERAAGGTTRLWQQDARGLSLEGGHASPQAPEAEPLAGLLHGWILARALAGTPPARLRFVLCSADSLALAELQSSSTLQTEGPPWVSQQLEVRGPGIQLRFGLDSDGFPVQLWTREGQRWVFEGDGPAGTRAMPAAGTPEACVADFLFGLAGDAGRLEGSADWPRLCLSVSLAASEAHGVEPSPELRARLGSDEAVLDFKHRLQASGRELGVRAVTELVLGLRVEQDGSRAQVLQAGGVVYSLEQQEGSWKIVALQP